MQLEERTAQTARHGCARCQRPIKRFARLILRTGTDHRGVHDTRRWHVDCYPEPLGGRIVHPHNPRNSQRIPRSRVALTGSAKRAQKSASRQHRVERTRGAVPSAL